MYATARHEPHDCRALHNHRTSITQLKKFVAQMYEQYKQYKQTLLDNLDESFIEDFWYWITNHRHILKGILELLLKGVVKVTKLQGIPITQELSDLVGKHWKKKGKEDEKDHEDNETTKKKRCKYHA